MITPDITELENAKGKGKNKRCKILEVLGNLKSVFTGVYLHYKDAPSESEESISERAKLRRQRSDEIADKFLDRVNFITDYYLKIRHSKHQAFALYVMRVRERNKQKITITTYKEFPRTCIKSK